MGDAIMQKADRLMAQAIEIVAGLYKDGIFAKPANYAFAYPDFLYFMRTYQAFFHVNPDYAYWYGWAMMTKDLGKIKELDHPCEPPINNVTVQLHPIFARSGWFA